MDPSVSCFIVCEERGFDFLPGSFHKRTLACGALIKHQGEVMILLCSSLLKGEEAKITVTLGEVSADVPHSTTGKNQPLHK